MKTTLDNGPKNELTGEQGYVDDERSCFWTWDDSECAWQSRQFKGLHVKRREGKGKGKGRSKRTGRAFFGDEHEQGPSQIKRQGQGSEKKKEGTCLQSGFSVTHPMKKDMARSGNRTIGLPVIGLMNPGLQMLEGYVQSLFLHGWCQLH